MNKLDELKELLAIAKEVAELEEKAKAKAKEVDEKVDKSDEEIDEQFADECSMTVTITKDERTHGSWAEVGFHGVTGKPDLMMIAVSAMSSIIDQFPKNKVEILAAICTMALTGGNGGIQKVASIEKETEVASIEKETEED